MLVMSITNRRKAIIVPDGFGQLQAGPSLIVGAGSVSNPSNFGSLQAGPSQIDGAGITSSVGSGALHAGASQIDGTGMLSVNGSGALHAGAAVIDGVGSVGGVVTSYANPGGTGNRTAMITVTTTALFSTPPPINNLVDGAFADNNTDAWFWNGSQVNRRLTFNFGAQYVVQEAKFYSNVTTGHGTWKWQGSNTNNGSDWVDLSTGFTLAGSTAGAVQGSLSANVTAYQYLSLLQTAGSTNGSPWHREWEFKISL